MSLLVFKSNIGYNVSEEDISFLYVPPSQGPFYKKSFSRETFDRINMIVNEISRMSVEIANQKDYIFSFIELLNDTNFYYMCSLRGILNNNGTEIYFVMSYIYVQQIMVVKSYSDNFSSIINALSSLNKLVNFGNLIIHNPIIYNQLLKGDSLNSITKYIDESNFRDRFGLKDTYLFCTLYPLDDKNLINSNMNDILFHELFPQWNLKNQNNLYLPNKDSTVASIATLVNKQYRDNYSFSKIGQNFIINYLFQKGMKISAVNIITINNQKYRLGCGIELRDFIVQSIVSKGDNFLTGSFVVDDTNYNDIFKVDTVSKYISNMYKVGIGKESPNSTLDVNDSGITDILNVIKTMANQFHKTNLNISKLINSSESDFANIIANFIDPQTGQKHLESVDSYYYLLSYDESILNSIYSYMWLLPNWVATPIGKIYDPQNNKLLNNDKASVNNNYIFDNSNFIGCYEWLFGTKSNNVRIFEKNGVYYQLGQGVNLQNFNLRTNTNNNISNFLSCLKTYSKYLQNIVLRLKNINSANILNFTKAGENLNTLTNSFPLQALYLFTPDYINYNNTLINSLDYQTLKNTSNPIKISEINDSNELAKRLSYIVNVYKMYSTGNNNPQLFNDGDYGIISFEDKYDDFLSLFYVYFENGVQKIISLELRINNFIAPSVDIAGDLRVKGDMNLYDYTNGKNYVSVDTNLHYFGINTDERFINYKNKYTTTSNPYDAQYNTHIKSNTYPNLVCERIQENASFLESNPPNYKYFKNYSATTIKRKSELYTFAELYKYASLGNLKYGVDMSFELCDKTDVTKEIGDIAMVIDKLDSKGDIKAGFSVNVVDNNPVTNETSERKILYVDNDSKLFVNSIKLGDYNLEVVKDSINGTQSLKWGSVILGTMPNT